MSFRDLDIKLCYESGVDDIVDNFYVPVLDQAKTYDRIAGFFSSSALAIAARGLAQFIKGRGKMRLLTSPILPEQDANIIKKIVQSPESLSLVDLGVDLKAIEIQIIKNHVQALGWMLKEGLLEIKLATIIDVNETEGASKKSKGLFHQKVGILSDEEGNELSFSGSINETASAWINNDEEFKVFTSWNSSHVYFLRDKNRFNEIWDNQRPNINLFDLPTAIREELIAFSKDFDLDSIAINNYALKKLSSRDNVVNISLFDYQQEAVEKWSKNGGRLLFEMATGTGKTRTAIAALNSLLKSKNNLLCVVSTPQNTLSKQWLDEIIKLGIKSDYTVIADGTNPKWRKELTNLLLRLGLYSDNGKNNHIIIFTTHNTASDALLKVLEDAIPDNMETVFIGDEVHWLGASQFRKALSPLYNYRIGLSATPMRWFDDEGSSVLQNYFGNDSFIFSIAEALTHINPLTGKHFLVNYFYKIIPVRLNEAELAQYKKYTAQLLRLKSRKDIDDDIAKKIIRVLENRANILKNAEAKYDALVHILDELDINNKLEDIIIFVSSEQIDSVCEILHSKKILFHRLTEKEGTMPSSLYGGISEREHIIDQFKKKNYKVLVAIKCMDEGIDIPSAKIGILMASSTNPREYVQRIGRVIRQDASKEFAYLYDLCVLSVDTLTEDEKRLEENIRSKEILRMREISKNAINSAEALSIILNH